MALIAIDPGKNGGITWHFLSKTHAEKMPETPKDIYIFLYDLVCRADRREEVVCFIEKVGGYVRGNSGPAAATFARHVGNLEMALLALHVRHYWVLPSRWMTGFIGVQKYPASMTAYQRKAKRKNLIKAKAQGLYPDIKVTLDVADALGILTWGMEQTL